MKRGQVYTNILCTGAVQINKQKMLANANDWAISWRTPTICTMAEANFPTLTRTRT